MSELKGKEDRPKLAILLTLVTLLFFSGIDTSAKWLLTAGMAAPVVVFFRYFGHLVISVAISLTSGEAGVWHMNRPFLTLMRGAMLVLATTLNFIALQYLTLTVTVSIFFTMPLMTTALAAMFLGEQVGLRRWTAIFVGFSGILVITQPWGAEFHWAMILSLMTTLFATIYNLITRVLAGQENPDTMQFYSALLPVVILAPWAFLVWTPPPSAVEWAVCALIGFCGWAGHQIWMRALRFAEASTLAPYFYFHIIYMAAASWLLFNQPPQFWTLVGASIVIGSGLYVWVREQALGAKQPAG